MELMFQTRRVTMSAALIMLAAAGCSKPPDMRDQRLVDLANESMTRQAQQNEHIAKQSQSVVEESRQLAEAAKELVAHDAQARQQLVEAQDRLNAQLNEQRTAIDAGRDQLEQERREIARQRHRDPLVAAAVQSCGLIIACLLPLIVSIYVIRRMRSDEPDDAALAQLLVQELSADQPLLLPGPSLRPPALEHQTSPDNPGESPSNGRPDDSELPF